MKILLISSNQNDTYPELSQTVKGYFKGRGKVTELFTDANDVSPNQALVISTKIKNYDAIVLETSSNSFYLGQILIIAVSNNKPVLVLSRNRKYHSYTDSAKYQFRTYRDKNDIEFILRGFEEFVASTQLTKFNFIIPSALDHYLEWQAREKKRPKSEIAREAIQKVMENDHEYRSYLLGD
jgi:hypothetical protein